MVEQDLYIFKILDGSINFDLHDGDATSTCLIKFVFDKRSLCDGETISADIFDVDNLQEFSTLPPSVTNIHNGLEVRENSIVYYYAYRHFINRCYIVCLYLPKKLKLLEVNLLNSMDDWAFELLSSTAILDDKFETFKYSRAL